MSSRAGFIRKRMPETRSDDRQVERKVSDWLIGNVFVLPKAAAVNLPHFLRSCDLMV